MSVAVETCENCGAIIGKLETPMVWKTSVVCAACHSKLSAASTPPPLLPPLATPAAPDFSHLVTDDERKPSPDYEDRQRFASTGKASAPIALGRNGIICPNPNCGYRGEGIVKRGGSVAVMFLLFCFGIIPGLLYALLCGGMYTHCPRCGVKVLK